MICGVCSDTPTNEYKNFRLDFETAASLVSEPNTTGAKYYITDGNGVNWYTTVHAILLQKNNRFSCSLLG